MDQAIIPISIIQKFPAQLTYFQVTLYCHVRKYYLFIIPLRLNIRWYYYVDSPFNKIYQTRNFSQQLFISYPLFHFSKFKILIILINLRVLCLNIFNFNTSIFIYWFNANSLNFANRIAKSKFLNIIIYLRIILSIFYFDRF